MFVVVFEVSKSRMFFIFNFLPSRSKLLSNTVLVLVKYLHFISTWYNDAVFWHRKHGVFLYTANSGTPSLRLFNLLSSKFTLLSKVGFILISLDFLSFLHLFCVYFSLILFVIKLFISVGPNFTFSSTVVLSLPSFASLSASSFPWIPTCDGIHTSVAFPPLSVSF